MKKSTLFLTLLAVFFVGTTSSLAGSFHYSRMIPDNAGLPSFSNPTGIVLDTSNNMYILDKINRRVIKCDPSGTLLTEWQVTNAQGIAIDGTNTLYITEGYQIQKFNTSGKLLSSIWLSGVSNGTAISLDAQGNIYILDSSNNRVVKRSAAGASLAQWGSTGAATSQFSGAKDILVVADSVYVADTGNARVQKFDTSGNFIATIGTTGTFKNPCGIATDAQGNLYVVDTTLHSILKFDANDTLASSFSIPGGSTSDMNGIKIDSSGSIYYVDNYYSVVYIWNSNHTLVRKMGTASAQEGHFNQPGAITCDTSGNLYIVDSANNRIQLLDNKGSFLNKWGTSGISLSRPSAIAKDKDNNYFIADTGNYRIVKISATGDVSAWGSKGNGNGEFNAPTGVAVDSTGAVYVSDSSNNRIQKFGNNGTYTTQWGSWSNDDFYDNGNLVRPEHIIVDTQDQIWVADSGNARVQTYDSLGNFKSIFGHCIVPGEGCALLQPHGMALFESRAYVTNTNFGSNDWEIGVASGMQHDLIKDLWFATGFGQYGTADGQLTRPVDIAIDSQGNKYVVDASNNRVTKYNLSDQYVLDWGSFGYGLGQFNAPTGIFLENDNSIYVVDGGNNRIERFSANGGFIETIGSNSQFHFPSNIARDRQGNIYIADSNNNVIQKYNANGEFITKWNTMSSSTDTLYYPWDLTIDSNDNIYVISWNNCVSKYRADGTFLLKWGTQGNGDGQFNYPFSIAVDSNDNIYVSDTGNSRIEKFTSTGDFITKWGSSGSNKGQFSNPYGIAVDAHNNIYVSDTYNNRIQVFNASGTFSNQLGSAGSAPGQFAHPRKIAFDARGNMYVADTGNNRIQVFAQVTGVPSSATMLLLPQ